MPRVVSIVEVVVVDIDQERHPSPRLGTRPPFGAFASQFACGQYRSDNDLHSGLHQSRLPIGCDAIVDHDYRDGV